MTRRSLPAAVLLSFAAVAAAQPGPAAPTVRYTGLKGGELRFELVNPGPDPLPYLGYTLDSFSPKLPNGRIMPLHRLQYMVGGVWQDEKLGWCGTGVGPVAVAGEQSGRFEVTTPSDREWTEVRVGVVWYAGMENRVAWSSPVRREVLNPKK